LQQELVELMSEAPLGIALFPEGDDIFQWVGVLVGPDNSPYAGLDYRVSLHFPRDYPFSPPYVVFLTPCFHPNVVPKVRGDVCLDILKDQWSAVLSASSILVSLQSLLGEPNVHSPLNTEAAELWGKDPKAYREKVLALHRAEET
jgi:ubiquitin-conjugating enzyme E2 C